MLYIKLLKRYNPNEQIKCARDINFFNINIKNHFFVSIVENPSDFKVDMTAAEMETYFHRKLSESMEVYYKVLTVSNGHCIETE